MALPDINLNKLITNLLTTESMFVRAVRRTHLNMSLYAILGNTKLEQKYTAWQKKLFWKCSLSFCLCLRANFTTLFFCHKLEEKKLQATENFEYVIFKIRGISTALWPYRNYLCVVSVESSCRLCPCEIQTPWATHRIAATLSTNGCLHVVTHDDSWRSVIVL